MQASAYGLVLEWWFDPNPTALIKSNGRNGTKPYVNEYLIECPPINVSQSIPRKSIKSAAATERIVNLIQAFDEGY